LLKAATTHNYSSVSTNVLAMFADRKFLGGSPARASAGTRTEEGWKMNVEVEGALRASIQGGYLSGPPALPASVGVVLAISRMAHE
jgi:hypothetical protein